MTRYAKLKHRLFFYLLRWWSDKNYYKLDNKNSIVCLIKDRPYDLKIIRTTELRTQPKEKSIDNE